MRIRFVPVSFVLSLALAPVGAAVLPQQRPSFTGTWASTTEAPAAMAAAPSAIMGARFALRLEGDGVVVTRPLRDDSLAVTLKLDGSRTSYTVPGRLCEGEPTSIETAAWEGDAMVLSSVGRIPPGGGATTTLNVKRTLRLTGPDTLVVQSTIVQAGETKPVATVYKRSADALAAPKATSAVKGTPATIAQLSWLPGVWIGVNGTTTTEERWTPTASGGTIGVSRTLRGEALGGFETPLHRRTQRQPCVSGDARCARRDLSDGAIVLARNVGVGAERQQQHESLGVVFLLERRVQWRPIARVLDVDVGAEPDDFLQCLNSPRAELRIRRRRFRGG